MMLHSIVICMICLTFAQVNGELDNNKSLQKVVKSSEENPAFSVSLKESGNLGNGKVKWTSVDINHQNLFNTLDNSLEITKTGIYYLTMTMTLSKTSRASFSLEKTGRRSGMTTYNQVDGRESINKRSLHLLTSLNRPYVKQVFTTSGLVGGNNRETAWAGFHYDTDHYFFGARDEEWEDKSVIPLPITMALRGFQKHGNKLNVLSTGLYFIGFSSAFNPLAESTLTIKSSQSSLRHSIRFHHITRHPIISSTSLLANLEEGENIELQLDSGSLYSDADLQTSLTLFKLDSNKSYFYSKGEKRSTCKPDSINFGLVKFDSDNSWIQSDQTYVAPKNGTYFISVNLSFFRKRESEEAYIEVNGVKKTTLYKHTFHIIEESLTMSEVLLKMNKGDKLRVVNRGCEAGENGLLIILIS
ncbi:DgyrCDS14967 [Dimorphilus gyrociliatus]|uniref:DgyrCDS14967 n=1 Tax=Dimorphilus gyrociliatus TaxID=2664684 RepID=A0A7I8WFI9_9ANNE|nr:DgyrCDS14967 [Dimorphilus gyrociliatus]